MRVGFIEVCFCFNLANNGDLGIECKFAHALSQQNDQSGENSEDESKDERCGMRLHPKPGT